NHDAGRSYQATVLAIMDDEVSSLIAVAKGAGDEAIERMKEAIELEAALGVPSGPPDPMKPASELFGEILLQLKKPEQAIEQFQMSLARGPNRSASAIGCARAYAMMGDRNNARAWYSQFLKNWHAADSGLNELKEAQS